MNKLTASLINETRFKSAVIWLHCKYKNPTKQISAGSCPKSRVEVIARSETTKQSFVFNSKFRSLRSARDDKITFWTTPNEQTIE